MIDPQVIRLTQMILNFGSKQIPSSNYLSYLENHE